MTRRLPYPQVKSLADPSALRDRLAELGVDLTVADEVDAAGVLATAFEVADPARLLLIPNRFCVLPMEGWDGTDEGRPSDLVRRRWERFGASGAGLVWGGEAVAVRRDGRANPHQLTINNNSVEDLSGLLAGLRSAADGVGVTPVVGLQLTHSGRWSRPDGPPAPRTARTDPLLDARVGATPSSLFSDEELDELVECFVEAAEVARAAGFDFVDLKACHGYLGHELLAAHERPGRYGGDLEGRSRFLRSCVDGVRERVPDLAVGVRLSVFDPGPFRAGEDGVGAPDPAALDVFSPVGLDGPDLSETIEVVRMLSDRGVRLVCTTVGSPYWSPHAQRPAWFPPSDGYTPPRDPIVDAVAMLQATRDLRVAVPGGTVVVGTGYTYFQQFIGHVAQATLDAGWVDSVGLGRSALSYPDLPADVLAGRPVRPRSLCRTFSDCTTAPRHGLVSGCYPLDEFYKARPERVELARIKRDLD
ncbi:MAG: NADH:flavin oxidoreductase [Actinomycetota bacterium]